MRVKAVLIVSFFLGVFSSAQEIRRIDLTGVPQGNSMQVITSGKYMICATDEAKSALKAVRVSVESLTPTNIHPRQQISVMLKVENHGQLPLVLPVSPQTQPTNSQTKAGSLRYVAILPLVAGRPGPIVMGWLELYGSTSRPNTTAVLRPGEWITVGGEIRVIHWSADEQLSDVHSALQLYAWLPGKSDRVTGQCVKQVSGASIPVQFESASPD